MVKIRTIFLLPDTVLAPYSFWPPEVYRGIANKTGSLRATDIELCRTDYCLCVNIMGERSRQPGNEGGSGKMGVLTLWRKGGIGKNVLNFILSWLHYGPWPFYLLLMSCHLYISPECAKHLGSERRKKWVTPRFSDSKLDRALFALNM